MSNIWAKGVCWWLCACYPTWHDYPSLAEGEGHGILLLEVHVEVHYSSWKYK